MIQLGLLKVLIVYFAFSSLDSISIFKLQKKKSNHSICNSQGPDETVNVMKRFFFMTTHSEPSHPHSPSNFTSGIIWSELDNAG